MKTIIILLLSVSTFGVYAQHDHATHEHKAEQGKVTFQDANVNEAYGQYILLKDALVASNADEARTAANKLQKTLLQVNDGKKAATEAAQVAAAAKLEDQRKAFGPLSQEMASIARAAKLTEGKLYIEYCPMANKNQGGLWLSNEKEIRNPYFGDMMLKCGSVKETIQ